MKLFLMVVSTFLVLPAIAVAVKNISAPHVSSQSSAKDDQPNHYHGNTKDISIDPNRLLEHFNTTTGQSPNDDQWVPLGNLIEGKAAGDYFGSSVAMSKSGNFIIVSGVYNDDNGKDSGHVQVYEYKEDGKKWEKVGGDILGEKAGDWSGVSVDINDAGDVIIIGSSYNDNQAGHARVFRLIDGQWFKQGQDLNGNGRFGDSVAISSNGGKVMVGGTRNSNSNGVVKVYEYNADTQKWEQIGLDILGEYAHDFSGWSVDMDDAGDVIIIGAPGNDANGSTSGHARIYRFIGGQWVKQGQDLDGKRALDSFGVSVAISDDGRKVIIGGQKNDDGGTDSGYAQVYEYKDDTQKWEQIGGDITGETPGDDSGWSVDMNSTGDVVIVGAPKNDGNGSDSGHARVYQYVDGQWVKQGQDLDGRLAGDDFGYDVAISGDGGKVIVGGPLNDVNGSNSGQVHAYILKKPPTAAQPSSMPSTQPSLPEVPSMAPSSSNYPTTLSSCSDSPLKVITDNIEGKKSAQSCSGGIAMKPKKFCWLNQIKTHCPYTCGICNDVGSSDSTGTFIFKGDVTDCKWVRNSNVLKASKLCQIDSINATCRKTCRLFCTEEM